MSQKYTFLLVAVETLQKTPFTEPLEDWNTSDPGMILTIRLRKQATVIQNYYEDTCI